MAQSDPPPSITWLKDVLVLTDTSVSLSYPFPMMSQLFIHWFYPKHAREVTCVAANPAASYQICQV